MFNTLLDFYTPYYFSSPPTTASCHRKMTMDPSIILFGKKIGLPETPKTINLSPENKEEAVRIDRLHEHTVFTSYDQRKDESDDNPKTPPIDEEGMSENPTETGTGILKKPDKIIPCPRCESMNTKFCYYNNSNINQPRHFCKSCQRYWTAGGTMRNMPVGAGRRKKKTTPSHCRVIISQEAFESAVSANQIEFAAEFEGVHPPKVLSFGPNSTHFGANLSGTENGNDCLATSSSVVEKIPQQDSNGFHSQVQWIPGGSWSYNPWNTMIPMSIPPLGYPPMPIYHSPYWSSVSWLPPTGPILGKHSRDEEAITPNGSDSEPRKQRNSVLTPKTLRIDDPDEAAKSSIWATLGIKNENATRGDLFKAFQTKGDEKKKQTPTEACPVLQANPAAFSRSLCFQERA